MELKMGSKIGIRVDEGESYELDELTVEHQSRQMNGEFTIIWRNLTYRIKFNSCYNLLSRDKQTEKVVFDRICGEAKSREITAIMGRSGAGKSSLLQCLFRNKSKGVTGQILVNSKSKKNLKICFIPQDDYLNEWLTVREDLLFVSRLKFINANELKNFNFVQHEEFTGSKSRKSTTKLVMPINHNDIVMKIAAIVGLSGSLDVRIKNISGGERKRLSIARELMSKPDILVLDEPTTGLDSLTCYKTIKVLRDLAKNSKSPMAIVVTIHQPERAVFNLFDKAYFLSDGRGIIYDEDPKIAIEIMKDVGKIDLPSKNYNPASFLIELASDSHLEERDLLTDHQRVKFSELIPNSKIIGLLGSKGLKAIQTSKYNATEKTKAHVESSESNIIHDNSNVDRALLESSDPNSYFVSNQLADCVNSHSIGFSTNCKHISILTQRAWLSIIRNPTLTKSRLTLHLLLPLFMLAVFGGQMGSKSSCPILSEGLDLNRMKQDILEGTVSKVYDDYRYVTENVAFFFIVTYGFSINVVCIAASFYPLTLSMFKKETANGLYSIGASLIAQIIAELPFEIFFPAISGLLSYKLSGQAGSYFEWRMLSIGFAMFLCCYFVHAMGLIAGLVFSDNVSAAVIMGQLSLMPFVSTCGFVVRYSRLPFYMRFIADWSIYKHFVNGFIATRYGFNLCDCNEDSLAKSQDTFLAPNVQHTMDYLFENDTQRLGEGVKFSDLFDKLNKQFMDAQTYGMKLDTCEDVRPYIMDTFTVVDGDLYKLITFGLAGIVILKFVVHFLLRHKKI